MNTPKKYRVNYSDHLIQNSLDALKFAQIGNSIYLTKETSDTEYKLRRECFLKARGIVMNVSTVSFIFLEHLRRAGEDVKHIDNKEEYFGRICGDIVKLLNGVMRADKKYK